ncbi:MAG: SCO6880 family protein, partial [Acidimicrobiia bacterium]
MTDTLTRPQAPAPAPTYGNWRRPKSPGLGRLGFVSTAVCFAGLAVVIAAMATSVRLGLVLALILGAVLLPVVWVDRWGRSGYERMAEWATWRWHRHARRHLYVAGPLSRTPSHRFGLPGLAAQVEASEATDAYGRPFVVLHHPRTGHVSTVLECTPHGDTLVDARQVNEWVGGWGSWLAGLSQEAGLVGAAVTIETAPDTGTRLRRAIEGRVAPDAPDLARSVLAEIADTFPAGSPHTTCRIALTWSRATVTGKRPLEDLTIDIGSRLPDVAAGLALAGAREGRAMRLAELAAAVRVAYDPDVATAVEELGPDAAGVDWSDAGPVSAEERPGEYLHDGAVSVSWMMGQAPHGAVFSNVLRNLLAPHPEIARKRVTLLYRPYAPGQATTLVVNDVRNAVFNSGKRRIARARDTVDLRSAQQAEEEEALGAGVVRFGLVVTAT